MQNQSEQANKERQAEEAKKELAIRTMFLQAFKGEPGKRALEIIYNMTGYCDPILSMKGDQSLDHEAMLYNEGRRSIWRQIRYYVDSDLLTHVEITAPRIERKTMKITKKEK